MVAAVVVLVATALGGLTVYARGGDRVSGGGGNVSGPVTIGEEFHGMVALYTDGGPVELISARPAGVSPGLKADVRLVDLNGQPLIGSARGPLGDGYEYFDLAGHQLSTSDKDSPVWLDLRLVATTPGEHSVSSVKVTYRDGLLRKRTAVLPADMCVVAADDWNDVRDRDCTPPSG